MQKHNEATDSVDSQQTTTDLSSPKTNKTRVGTAWFLIVSFIIGLALLLVFILQNLRDVSVQFISFHWNIPLGIAMLMALVAGGLLVALFGTARVVQLGRKLRSNKN